MLADMVHVSEQMLRTIMTAAQTSEALLVSSRYAQTLAPPAVTIAFHWSTTFCRSG